MNKQKWENALRLMIEELEYPSRELRLLAQVSDCKEEIHQICEWLRKEVQRELDTTTMFD